MKMEERERSCLELLGKLPKDRFILIGGYATSSYDFPRFSVDLDIVIRKKDIQTFRKIAEADGFREVEAGDLEDIYGSGFGLSEKVYERITKKAVKIIEAVKAEMRKNI